MTLEQSPENYIATSQFYIVDVASRGLELFTAEGSKLYQKWYLLNFVFSNVVLDRQSLSQSKVIS
jgi:hypothetical protein